MRVPDGRLPLLSSKPSCRLIRHSHFSLLTKIVPSRFAALWFLQLLLLATTTPAVQAKRAKGQFQLSHRRTEQVLTSFAVGKRGGGFTVRLGIDEPYPNEESLKFRVYTDVAWKKYKKTKRCSEKVKLAETTVDSDFTLEDRGNRMYLGGAWQSVHTISMPPMSSPHYFYFVVDDCSLGSNPDLRVPKVDFEIDVWNYHGNAKRNHLSLDELDLQDLHEFCVILSFLALTWLVFNIIRSFARKKSTVHISLLWIATAAVLDFAGSTCQLMHLEMFQYRGFRSSLFLAGIALFEATCDALIMLFLLSIGSGWTLPNDVVGVNPNASSFQALVNEVASPLAALVQQSRSAVMGLIFVALQAGLAVLGSTYYEESENYHDYTHWPGHVVISIRVALGFLFLATTLQTRLRCRMKQLQSFYFLVALLGFTWFELLPSLTFMCNWMVPLHWRRTVIFIGNGLLQSGCIIMLSWLVTSHATAYHQYSHISNHHDEMGLSLTESLSSSKYSSYSSSATGRKELKLFGKTKIRFD